MSFQDAKSKKAEILRKAKEAANAIKPDALMKKETVKYIKPEDAESRIRIIFDNSGSMRGEKIQDAKKGIVEFLRNCRPNQDAVAIHLLEKYTQYNRAFDKDELHAGMIVSDNVNNAVLMTDLVMLASNIDDPAITAIGGTPLFERIIEAIKADADRLVAFSDGDANWDDKKDEKRAIDLAVNHKINGEAKKIPIDCVYFGQAGSGGACTLERVAEATGGIFLVFDPNKGVNFASAFKYLAPTKRLMLMNEEFKAKLQRGEVK